MLWVNILGVALGIMLVFLEYRKRKEMVYVRA
jgi:hypothetical protein